MYKKIYYSEQDIFQGKLFFFAKKNFSKKVNPLYNDYCMEEFIDYKLVDENEEFYIYKPEKAVRYLYELVDDEKALIDIFENKSEKFYDFINFNDKEIYVKNFEDRYLINFFALWEDDLPPTFNKNILFEHTYYLKKKEKNNDTT